jgi:hypothetical protein
MKAEHRKELQTNALADRIGRFFKGMRSPTQRSSLMVWLIVLVVLGIVGAWWFYSKAAKRNRSERWVSLDRIADDEIFKQTGFGSKEAIAKAEKDLEDLISKNEGTEAALMAKFRLAQLHLRVLGLDRLAEPNTGSEAVDSIKNAKKEYQELADESKDDPYWKPQALLGVAKATEALAVEDIQNVKEAADLYSKLEKDYPNSAAGMEAKKRCEQLKDNNKLKDIEQFYGYLSKRWNYKTRGTK